ncbi:hypothetical protein HDF16_005824 [Granulicella aggregans]|uniref:Uncharacterized protein n=1 Tax=Granulicella aggregans TaxID=474949 RepID=A0A7W7ZJM0_9BACT|nr:hypothetical protein [Granulicella aggregans]
MTNHLLHDLQLPPFCRQVVISGARKRSKMRDPSITFRNWLAHLFSPRCVPLELKRPAMAYETCLCLVTHGKLRLAMHR